MKMIDSTFGGSDGRVSSVGSSILAQEEPLLLH
jgi:hypothetical protein